MRGHHALLPAEALGRRPGPKVAIVGMGGLGHMGVKIAHALGAEVTVLSQSLTKQEDGQRLGADHYYATSDAKTFEELASTLRPDREHGLGEPAGRRLPVPAPARRHDGQRRHPGEPDSFQAFSLAAMRRRMAGSKIGGIRETQEMLDFCAEHGMGAEIETIGVDDVNGAYDRVVNSDVRYRFVIDIATF